MELLANIICPIIDKRIELASMYGLPYSSVTRIKSCKVIPKIDTLLKIMRSLGITLSVSFL